MHIAATFTKILVLGTVLISGCASTPGGGNDKASRKIVGSAEYGWLYARSVYENPINRPVSHATSLASYVLKSTGGALRRASIGTLEMPALNGEIPAVANNEPMDLAEFEDRLDRVTGTRSDLGRINFLVDGDEFFCRLERAIEDAESSIDIRTYIYDNDDYALELADKLKKRSADVRVRVLVDSLGTMRAAQVDPESLPEDHKAPLSIRNYLESDSKVHMRRSTNPWLTGDHTKTTVIDGRTAFVGGMNIGREYRYDWHDLMMEVTGPVVNQLQHESNKAWARASMAGDLANLFAFMKGKPANADEDGYPVRILQTRNFDSDIHKAQIAAIQAAQSYILIQNAYFSDDRTIYELAKARRRGVDVRVIIPSKGNHGPLNASNKVTINTMLRHGIRVYEYPGMSHVKAAIYDGWASVGSANFDKLSLKVNKELNIATSHPEAVNELLERVFIPDLAISQEITAPVDVTMATHFAEIVVDELL